MNDLTLYRPVAAKMLPADGLAFRGVAPVSHAIELFAGDVTHVALVQSAELPGGDVLITQSTIEPGHNGVQSDLLGPTLANYGDGAGAEWLPLLPEVRARMNWQKYYAFIAHSTGLVRYDKEGLVLFALHECPIAGQLVRLADDPHKMFCSCYGTLLIEAAGGLPPGMDGREISPKEFVGFPIFQPAVPIMGKM